MHLADDLHLSCNVTIRVRDRAGHVVDERVGHNVFTNQGRAWLRNMIVARTFGGAPFTGDQNLCEGDVSPNNSDTYAVEGRTYRVRYVGFGVGGSLQTISPPGKGGQVASGTTLKLELPVLTANGQYLKQVVPHASLSDLSVFPEPYTARVRCVFGYGDVSFVGQPIYGTNVPLSEVMLYTSKAPRDPSPGSLGSIAYHQFSPISKTPKFVLEVDWDLRT